MREDEREEREKLRKGGRRETGKRKKTRSKEEGRRRRGKRAREGERETEEGEGRRFLCEEAGPPRCRDRPGVTAKITPKIKND